MSPWANLIWARRPRHISGAYKLPTIDEIEAVGRALGPHEATRRIARLYAEYEAQTAPHDPIRNPNFEALRDGYTLPQWQDAIRELSHCRLLYFSGGRRASKSQCCAWMFLTSIERWPGGYRWCISDSEATSQATQQPTIWHYLRNHYRARNMKESDKFKIKFQAGRGFTDNILVLDTKPEPTTIKFLTKNQKVTDYQGWALGGKPELASPDETWPNIGVWIDEDITSEWLQTAMDRSSDRGAKVIWSFTPLRGITQTVRELIGSAPRLIESKPAPLLPPDRRAVREMPDLPPGQMPYRIECSRPNARAIFFFKDANPWANYEAWVEENKHLDENSIQREAYGWTREVRGRAFPKFGAVHIMRTHQLPKVCTNYRFADPHGKRMWAVVWVRVWPVAGGRLKRVIYRDWPNVEGFGEWAIPTQRSEDTLSQKGADGDPGPAAEGRGFGTNDYKRAILAAETIPLYLEAGVLTERDPYRLQLAMDTLAAAGFRPDEQGRYTQTQLEDFKAMHPDPIREVICRSFFDPRACANPQAGEDGGTNLLDLMYAEQRNASGQVQVPSMIWEPAFSGKGLDDGYDHVNDLLSWDDEHPDGLVLDYNDPRLFVADSCYQVRWMFDHFTGLAGKNGASKEWADLMRYVAQTELAHITDKTLGSRYGGAY